MTVPPGGSDQSASPESGPADDRDAAIGPDSTLTFQAVGSTESVETDSGPSQADVAAIEALPAGSALLVVQRGPNAGARFLLDADRTTAGRRPQSDIFLDDVTVSRKHAEFIRRDGEFVVRDVGSLNGTYVQRDRIDEAALKPGDEVQIGKYRLVFHPSPLDSGRRDR